MIPSTGMSLKTPAEFVQKFLLGLFQKFFFRYCEKPTGEFFRASLKELEDCFNKSLEQLKEIQRLIDWLA